MYQNQSNGKIPIFTSDWTNVWLNYLAYGDNPFKCYTGLGLMAPAGVIKNTWAGPAADLAGITQSPEGKVFYCPSSYNDGDRSRQFGYIDPSNPGGSCPWLAGPETPGYTTRLTYGVRPEYTSNFALGQSYPLWRLDMKKTTKTTRVDIVRGFTSGTGNTKPIFPKANGFSNKSASAIVMDMNDATANRAVVHRGGLNALYGDWSAKTVPTGLVKRHVDEINLAENGGTTAHRRWAHFQLWLEMDRF
jgi:hypothetical protein